MTASNDNAALVNLCSSTLKLLCHFTETMRSSQLADLPPNPPDPLDVLHDAAKLLKAQTTKLSLLFINKPFTPNVISNLVRDVSSTCLPALMSAVEICQPHRYGRSVQKEVRIRVETVFTELKVTMQEIGTAASGRSEDAFQPQHSGRDSLASTGVVWQACDALMELKSLGIAGIVSKQAQQYQDTIKDAIQELREWADETEDEEDEGFVSDEDHESVEDVFQARNKMPETMRSFLEETVRSVELVNLLYQALIKRRLTAIPIPPDADTVRKLDLLMSLLQSIPEKIDEMAEKLYDLDEESALVIFASITRHACEIANITSRHWDGSEDKFTAWSKRCMQLLGDEPKT